MTSYGKSCQRCRIYFVARSDEEKLCHWCQTIEAGMPQPELYEAANKA